MKQFIVINNLHVQYIDFVHMSNCKAIYSNFVHATDYANKKCPYYK